MFAIYIVWHLDVRTVSREKSCHTFYFIHSWYIKNLTRYLLYIFNNIEKISHIGFRAGWQKVLFYSYKEKKQNNEAFSFVSSLFKYIKFS